jgi:heme-degrading monooxygenase HmoA
MHKHKGAGNMSVVMTLRVPADAKKVEELAGADPALLKTIIERGKQHGLISHRFYGNDAEVLVVDEWPDEASFQAFFAASPDIRQIMEAAGAGEPVIKFWRELETGDRVG